MSAGFNYGDGVEFDPRGLLSYQTSLQALSGAQWHMVLRQALQKAGDKTRTQVRIALRQQTNVKAARDVNERTRGFLVPGQFSYKIGATKTALPIDRVKGLTVVTGPGGGVQAAPWNVLRQFKRSFVEHGKFVARLGPDRFPMRRLYGPSMAQELIRDESYAAFERVALPELEMQIVRALTRAVDHAR